ncbi:hypothetical protein ACJA88_015111 [Fusarium oxysporum]
MGIMIYDLYGQWDEDIRQIRRVILGHTNIPEITNWSLPLDYAGVNPAKVNMGLAYYARGYTVADLNYNGVGCKWSGTSRPAPCINFGGIMSLEEIERMVRDEPAISLKLLPKYMMMELKFGNQWIGHDKDDTIYMKKFWKRRYADNQSDGGLEDPGGGQGDGSGVIYIDPEIWEEDQPEVKCHPPCTMVLPPSSLKKPVTLTLPPYETSLDVAWSGKDGWHSTLQKTTLTLPVVTVTTADVWHITIREDRTKLTTIWSTFDITPSIKVPTFIITNRLPETTKDSESLVLYARRTAASRVASSALIPVFSTARTVVETSQTSQSKTPETTSTTKPERTLECQHGVVCTGDGFGCVVDVLMSVTVKNGCRFTVSGKGPKSECGRILKRMIDECGTSDVRYKKGGTMSSNCADWKFDPNYHGWWSKNQCSA